MFLLLLLFLRPGVRHMCFRYDDRLLFVGRMFRRSRVILVVVFFVVLRCVGSSVVSDVVVGVDLVASTTAFSVFVVVRFRILSLCFHFGVGCFLFLVCSCSFSRALPFQYVFFLVLVLCRLFCIGSFPLVFPLVLFLLVPCVSMSCSTAAW